MKEKMSFGKVKDGFHNLNKDFWGGSLPEKLYSGIKISNETQGKIEEIQEFIGENKEINNLYYGPHNTKGDALVLGYATGKIDLNKTRHIVTVVGYDYLDNKKILKNFGSLAMYQVVRWCGLETLPVIQTDKDGKPVNGHTWEEANKCFGDLINRLNELKKDKIPTAVILFPEGTRSKDGRLQKAKSSIVRIAQALAPVICVPVGIIFEKGYERDSMNFGKEVEITIGKTYIMENGLWVHKTRVTDLLMDNLADALPIEMRGVYAGNFNNFPEARK